MQHHQQQRGVRRNRLQWRFPYATLHRIRAAHLDLRAALHDVSSRLSPESRASEGGQGSEARFPGLHRSGERCLSSFRIHQDAQAEDYNIRTIESVHPTFLTTSGTTQAVQPIYMTQRKRFDQIDGQSPDIPIGCQQNYQECVVKTPLTDLKRAAVDVTNDDGRFHKTARLELPVNGRIGKVPAGVHEHIDVQSIGVHTGLDRKYNPHQTELDKLNAFDQNTIVRRSHIRKGHGALGEGSGQASSPAIITNIAAQACSTDVSSPRLNNSVSPQSVSTAATSLESFGKTANSAAPETKKGQHGLNPIHEIAAEEPEAAQAPSIRTVEKAASAKSFLEMYYNSFQGIGLDARESRRIDLEARLSSAGRLAYSVREQQRQTWRTMETNHLRRTRVAKSQYLSRKRYGGTVLADRYECTKRLGSGSFGVVRLARRANQHGQKQLPQAAYSTVFPGTLSGYGTDLFAIKIIKKSGMLRSSQEAHIRAERDALVAAERSKWVVTVFETFEDRQSLYLVMEFMAGGDFLGLLMRRDRLVEDQARFYIAEMILCVEEAHRLGFVHRDVKPDNFLISASGHLKISDFGLAFDGHWSHDQAYYTSQRYALLERLGIRIMGDELDRKEQQKANLGSVAPGIILGQAERTAILKHQRLAQWGRSEELSLLDWRAQNGRRNLALSVVGTSQYMAPEVIRGDSYDGRCDWWSIGIILFECLYGETPFVGHNRQTTKYNIIHHDGRIPFVTNSRIEPRFRVSNAAKNLVNCLLQEKETRLSCPEYSKNDLCTHRRLQRLNEALLMSAARSGPKFLYPNDASDVKAHPFFIGIDWKRLHLVPPPEVPRLRHSSDTQYFGQSTSVNEDSSDAGFSTVLNSMPPSLEHDPAQQHPQLPPWNTSHKANTKRKIQKRARDCILRDPDTAKDAMDVRKENAFMGYAHQRPNEILAFLDGLGSQR